MPSGFAIRIPVTTPVTAGDETDYVGKVTIPFVSGMQSDFRDVRFYDSDESTALEQGRIGYVDGVSSEWLVKVPLKLAAGGTIYAYAINSSLELLSNIGQVAEFYDDFSGDLSKWTLLQGTYSDIESGRLRQRLTWGELTQTVITKVKYGVGRAVRFKIVRGFVGGTWRVDFGFGRYTLSLGYMNSAGGATGYWRPWSGSSTAYPAAVLEEDASYTMEVQRLSSTQAKVYMNGNLDYTLTHSGRTTEYEAFITSQGSNPSSDAFYVDEVIIYKTGTDCSVGETEYLIAADFTFSPSKFCNPETVQFVDRSLGTPDAWLWNFGDGETSTEQNPTHTYRSEGKYTVTLTAYRGGSSSVLTITDALESMCVMLSCYISQIRGSVGEEDESEDFPFDLYRDWVHKDVCETAKNILSVSKSFYRQASSLPVQNSEGMVFTEISKAVDSLVVTGFSGLIPDDYVGGAIFVIYNNLPYRSKIVSNTATEVTLEDELDLPALVNADVIISRSVSGLEVDLSSLRMFWIENPFWFIEDGGGGGIGMAPLEFDNAVDELEQYDGKVFCRIEGRKLQLMLGSGAKLPGIVNLGYWREPNKAMTVFDCIDLPLEFHSLAQMLTIARIRAKNGDEAEANSLRARYSREIRAVQNSLRRVEKQEKFFGDKLN